MYLVHSSLFQVIDNLVMTKSQEIAVAANCAALIVLDGSLSLLGLTAIIYNIVIKQKLKNDSYHWLLLGTCAFDVMSSLVSINHVCTP